jgi:hypothetical protein
MFRSKNILHHTNWSICDVNEIGNAQETSCHDHKVATLKGQSHCQMLTRLNPFAALLKALSFIEKTLQQLFLSTSPRIDKIDKEP